MTTFAVLLKKEFKQNLVIYIVPLLIWAGLLLMQSRQWLSLTPIWQSMLAVIIPVALAISYGLQSFDLEENGQTRDFLLTRPITVSNIVYAKYLSGFAVLLVIGILWPIVILPSIISWPNFDNFGSFYYCSYLLTLGVLYSTSFFVGIYIKGPAKLLVGVISGACAVCWFFYIWYELITLFYLQLLGNLPTLLVYSLLILLTGGFVYMITSFLLKSSQWELRNPASKTYGKKLRNPIIVFMILPLCAGMINLINPPVIRPFNSLIDTLFGKEQWFIAVEGKKQPHGNLYLFNSVDGRLGIARPGEKPAVIYSPKSQELLASNVSWSPDGTKVAFKEGAQFKIGTLKDNQFNLLYTIDNTDSLEWSSDSTTVLVGKTIQKSTDKATDKITQTIQLNHVQLHNQKLIASNSLRTAGLAHAWDSRAQRLIILDPNWQLILFSLNGQKIESIPLTSTNKKNLPPIPFGMIAPPANNSHIFRLALFTNFFNHRYDIVLYDFDSLKNTLTFKKILSKVNYKDLILEPNQQSLLARMGIGTYYSVESNRK